jgi:hypothetical protein
LISPVLFALDLPVDDREWGSLAPVDRVRRVRNAITIVLALMAKATPVVILIEDMHWIDSDSAAVLDRLVDGIATQRILLLMTFRPEYNPLGVTKPIIASSVSTRCRATRWNTFLEPYWATRRAYEGWYR